MSLRVSVIFFIALLGAGVRAQDGHDLDYYLKQAVTNSPLLKDYQNQIRANAIDSIRIRAGYKPQINAVSNNSYAPSHNSYGYDINISNGGQFSALVTLNQQLVGKKYTSPQFDNIALLNETINNTSKISEQDLKKAITAQYIAVYGDQQQLQYLQENNELLRREDTILRSLTEKSVYNQTDYITFLVTLQQQNLQQKQVQIQVQNDFAVLNYLCGIFDTSAMTLPKPAIEPIAPTSREGSIFFRQFITDSLKLINSKAIIGLAYKPKVGLYADAGYFTSVVSDAPYKNFGASVGLNLSIPIYDGKQKKLQFNKLALADETRKNYRDFFTTQYNQSIAQITQQIQTTRELAEQAKGQVKFYEQNVIKIYSRLLSTGDARITDYVVVLGSYLQAQYLLTQNNIAYLQLLNQLNYWNR